MKKFTFLMLCILCMTSLAFGQNQVAKTAPVDIQEISKQSAKILTSKGGGDVIWAETFNWADSTADRGWSLPEGWSIVDQTDLGAPWIWADTIVHGDGVRYNPPAEFDTPEDGFICVPARMYSGLGGYTLDEVSYSTYIMTPALDFSSTSSIVVNLKHHFRLCCNNTPFTLIMQITNDNGVHWADFNLMHGTAINASLNKRHRSEEINISDVAAGMPEVYIRFLFDGPMYYYWMIDDLVLTEAYENELVLEDTWSDFMIDQETSDGHINYIPLSQYGTISEDNTTIGSYLYAGAMLNNGLAYHVNTELKMTVLKNGEQVYQEVSETVELDALWRDTSRIDNPFIADGYGDYVFQFDLNSELVDEVIENNTNSVSFTINDSLYHRADFSSEGSANGGGFVDGNNSGDIVGNVYQIYETSEVNSITCFITSGPSDLPIESTSFIFNVLKYIDEDEEYVPWITSEIMSLDSTMLNNWLTLELEKDGESEFLEPGEYVAGVEMLGENGNGMSIGWDKDTKSPNYASFFYMVDDDPSIVSNYYKLSLIGLVFNEKGGPTEAQTTFNVNMNAHIANNEFDPASDVLTVEGKDVLTLADEDEDGIYSATAEGMPVGHLINYVYKINGLSEFADSEATRSFTVRYWNIRDDIFNYGETTGIEDLNLVESFNIYPNPTQGDFTVQVRNSKPADICISLMDIQGHVVFSKEISNTVNHTEIVKNDFAHGIYFLKVNTGTDVKVKRIIIN